MPAKALSRDLIEVVGRRFPVETRRSVSRTEAEGLARQLARGFLVADRISNETRQVLAEGHVAWLDRRGHLQLRGTAVHIDADVPPLIGPEPTRVATELATLLGRSPGRVSEILAALRDRGLVDRQGRPSIPDLFDEMAESWTPAWRPVGSLPGHDSDLFRLSGTLGADWHKAPVVATVDWPAELYVESQVGTPERDRLLRSATGHAVSRTGRRVPVPLWMVGTGRAPPPRRPGGQPHRGRTGPGPGPRPRSGNPRGLASGGSPSCLVRSCSSTDPVVHHPLNPPNPHWTAT